MTERRDFTQLPDQVLLEETAISVDERTVQPPEGDRNQALWDAQEAGG
ncbi:MAG TPA: hypothetical protein VNS46_08500 [Nocardioides sp.]|nr:hypothetical protein [Nocardioides sp.]